MGPAGPQGETGPMGPAGPTLFPQTRVYSVGGPIVNSGTFPESIATSETICDIWDIIINGGGLIFPTSFTSEPGQRGEISIPLNTNSWFLRAVGANLQVQALAQCFDNPPLRP